MCGINGIYALNKGDINPQTVAQMNQVLKHRGPDDQGVATLPNAVLGHVRLAIIDLSQAGKQPMHSQNPHRVLCFNGEIYNYRELKKQLPYPYKGNSDSEVLLAAYNQWGHTMCEHLEGMFAFCIYDSLNHSLFLARDRMGIKPLYYTLTPEYLVFSSEIRALMASGLVPTNLNHSQIQTYLTMGTLPGNQTLIQSVQKLNPGSFMICQGNQIQIQSYWNPQNYIKPSDLSFQEALVQTRNLFANAVQKRMMADVPFGAFLSGGIDSTAVTAMMSQFAQKPVNTFHVSFAEKEFSEQSYAEWVAKKYNTQHINIQCDPSLFLQEMDAILDSYDHPCVDGANTYIVSQATRKAGITMALSGLGGDELFGGYPIFNQLFSLHNKVSSIPLFLRKIIAFALPLLPVKSQNKLRSILNSQSLNPNKIYFILRSLNGILPHPLQSQDPLTEPTDLFLGRPQFNYSEISLAECYYYLEPILLRDADQMSMRHALEVRVPFLDHKLVEWVLGLPDEFKRKAGTPKALLVQSLSDLIPNEVVYRKKMGFVLPWELWVKKELSSYVTHAIENSGDIIQSKAWMKAYDQFVKGSNQYSWTTFWSLVTLQHWRQKRGV